MIFPEPSLFRAMSKREITSAKGTSVSNLTNFAVKETTVFGMLENEYGLLHLSRITRTQAYGGLRNNAVPR